MTHYEALGVSRSATTGEIRRAYLALARDHHPDRHAGSPPAVQEAAERRMRAVNEAWTVLGDLSRRRRYDAELDRSPTGSVADDEPVRVWQPYGGFDVADDPTDPRLDESNLPPPRGGRALAMTPATVFSVGLLFLVVGIATQGRGLLTVGLIGVILGGIGFAAAPFLVIMESRRNDEP
ncbi:MAG: J domain-containing protein [Acidimicrobiales bacterium]